MFDELQTIISKVETKGADFVEARYDELLLRTIIKDNERIQECKAMKRAGVGFNVYYKGATGYAFSADLSKTNLEQSAMDALSIAKASALAVSIKSEIEPLEPIKNVYLKPKIREPAWLVENHEKLELLSRMEDSMKENGKDIASIKALYGELSGEKLFTNSEGTEIHWHPFLLDVRCEVTSKTSQGDLVNASDVRSGSIGLEHLKMKNFSPEDLGKNAALWAREKIKAKVAPAGIFRALCENILVGVLAHESFGHLTEGDFVVSKGTPIHNKLGEILGSEYVTIIDEGTPIQDENVSGFWLPYDDQGVKTKHNVLIENGLLKEFLHSRSTAKLLKAKPTGNARAVNFTFAPIPRMKNTYFLPGDLTEEEAIKQLGTGIYAINTLGGQVGMDGSFFFKAVRGYWVENGEKKYPLKDVSLTGNILQLLKNVEGATKDLVMFATYFGGCGKDGQSPLPVGLGGPKLLINNVRFGGEE
ncbi:MAG: TldD/PmbA family protein [Promethearchaeota archaeon]